MTRLEILAWSYRGVKAVDRFRQRVPRSDIDSCWEWTGCRNDSGYGIITIRGNLFIASRLAWILANGDIPNGLFVLHECDNPPCCNPNHLFLGTHQDNNDDAIKKGRWKPEFGEDIGTSKLTAKQVEKIRNLYRDTDVTQKILGERFGVTEANIKHIIDGRAWKRAGGPVGTKKDAYRNWRGEGHRDAKLTEDNVKTIRQLHADGLRGFEIAKMYPVTRPTIYGILNGKYWSHI